MIQRNGYDTLMEMVIGEDNKSEKQRLAEAYKGSSDIKIYADSDNAYILEADIFDFMKNNHIYAVDEAVDIIAKVRVLDENSIVIIEKVEKDAMSLKQAQKWYNKFITASKSKTENISDIDERITVLKNAVTAMEKEAAKTKGISEEKAKYMAKALIPFNGFARLVSKQHDAYAFLADLAGSVGNALLPGVGLAITFGMRVGMYNKMLQGQIDKTKDAIEYLEKMKAELKKSK